MKRIALIVAAVCGVSFAAVAQSSSKEPGTDQTCGQKIKENAKYPLQLNETLTAVADTWAQHASWVGTRTKEAKAEHDQLMKLSNEMREMAKQSQRIAKRMQEADRLPAADHDMKAIPPAMLTSMERARDEQRRFGQLLLAGAQEMDQQLNAMKGVGGAGSQGTEPMQGTGGSGTEGMEAPQPADAPPPTTQDDDPTRSDPISPDVESEEGPESRPPGLE